MALRPFRLPVALRLARVHFMARPTGECGSGAGKGGGTGGSVRDVGGAFGKLDAAHEEMYFKKLEHEQMAELRKHLEEEVNYLPRMALRPFRLPAALRLAGVRFMARSTGEYGSGARKGGGTGGSERDAGGTFGKMDGAHKEMYFKKLEHEQLAELRKHLEEEVKFHTNQINDHKKAIERHRKKIHKLHHQESDIHTS